MPPKPLIGLTATRRDRSNRQTVFEINLPYVNSIAESGGLPVLLPLDLNPADLDLLLARLDGVVFTGGFDIDPQVYGNPFHAKVEGIDKNRDRTEVHLVHKVISSGKPFLGICRGLQLINVALGGTLYEDLPEQHPGEVQHDNHNLPRNHLAHPVSLQAESRLAEMLGGGVAQVNSLHHQGIRNLAKKLRPTAYAPDGLVEAFELPGHPFGLAVQWHPEELLEQAPMRRIFQEFVQACLTIRLNPMQ